jgi:hypothetical protein
MANIEAQIKPTGMSQRNLVDLLYMLASSFKGLCTKLDNDSAVSDTDHVSLCYTALFNGYIEDSRGNSIMNRVSAADDRFFIITPTGIDNKALTEFLYQWFDMFETLTEKLDAGGGVSDTNYEALCYTALYLWKIENCKGSMLGNGTAFYFRNAAENRKELVNLLYAIVDSWETLAEKLDADGTVNNTNYEALWFTATILMRVENSLGNVVGNTITITP